MDEPTRIHEFLFLWSHTLRRPNAATSLTGFLGIETAFAKKRRRAIVVAVDEYVAISDEDVVADIPVGIGCIDYDNRKRKEEEEEEEMRRGERQSRRRKTSSMRNTHRVRMNGRGGGIRF